MPSTSAGARPRTVVLSCDGLPQRHFLARLAVEAELTGVVLQATPAAPGRLAARFARYRRPGTLARHLTARLLMEQEERRAEPLRRRLFAIDGVYPELPQRMPVLRTADVNAPEVVSFVRDRQPDIVLVNGTNLLREPMLALQPALPLGIVNLHTGLSPYARGGNCNLWVLLEEHPEWVGVSVHHIDPGIDSGDLLRTAQTPIEAEDSYAAIDLKTFRFGFDLLLEELRRLVAGTALRVPQWEGGRLYLRRTGYVYEPWIRVRVSRLLRRGLVARYLADRATRDATVRLVGGRSG